MQLELLQVFQSTVGNNKSSSIQETSVQCTMLGEKKTVLYISENTIYAHQVNGKKNITVQWVPETFVQSLKIINKKLSIRNSRILLGEDVSYLSLIDVPEPDIKNRKKIQKLAQQVIPEELENTGWDYIVVEKTIPKSKAQVIATTNEVTKVIKMAMKELKVKFEAIEPLSYSLAQLTRSSKQPQVIIHEDKTIVIAHKGKVYTSAIPDLENIDQQLGQLINYTYDTFNIEPNKIFLSTTSEDNSTIRIGISDNRIIKTIIDPFTEIALKSDLKNPDEELLNIVIEEKETAKVKTKKTKNKKEQRVEDDNPAVNKNLMRLLIFILILAPVLIGIFLLGRDNSPKEYINTPETQGSINDAINSYENYSVLIEDYSNSDIAAQDIQDELLRMGFGQIVIEKFNENRSENLYIEINYKESLSVEIYDDINLTLNDYHISENELLTEENIYDLVLMLGTFN